ncbi:MAG: methyl-accepting chemotaxis protein [Opitutales bacterium]
MTIGQRITAAFGVILVITITLSVFVHHRVGVVRDHFDEIATSSIPSFEYLAEAQSAVQERQALIYRQISSPDPEDRNKLEVRMADNKARIDRSLAAYEQLLVDETDRHAFALIKAAREPYEKSYQQVVELGHAAATPQDSARLCARVRAELDPLHASILWALTACFTAEKKQAGESADETHRAVAATNTGALTGGIVALLAVTGLGWVIIRGTNTALREVTGTLADAAGHVSAAARQISGASQTLAEGASEQAASLEETSASIEEISSMAKRNAAGADNTQKLAQEARQATAQGAQQMREMVSAMDAIQASSDNIAKIVKNIDEVAFQTNILALNAAVEAARAGEAGAGFAVVAEEVRALAQRAAQAARETAEKIEDSIQKSHHGADLSARVAQSLQDIEDKVARMNEVVGEIAIASQEQTQGLTQVGVAVVQMDQVTQGNAGTAEETASAAAELNSQSGVLVEKVGRLLALVGGQHQEKGKAAVRAPAAPTPVKHPSGRAPAAKAPVTSHPLTPMPPSRQDPAPGSGSDLPNFVDFSAAPAEEHPLKQQGSGLGDLDVAGALKAHVDWKVRLQKYLHASPATREKLDAKVVGTDCNCALGRWIHDEAVHSPIAGHPEFAQLKQCHASFHRSAAKIIEVANRGDNKAARDLLNNPQGEFNRYTAEVSDRLSALKRHKSGARA